MKIITIIKNGKRFDIPKDKFITKLDEIKKMADELHKKNQEEKGKPI